MAPKSGRERNGWEVEELVVLPMISTKEILEDWEPYWSIKIARVLRCSDMSATEGIVEVRMGRKECLQKLAARRGFPARTSTPRCSREWKRLFPVNILLDLLGLLLVIL